MIGLLALDLNYESTYIYIEKDKSHSLENVNFLSWKNIYPCIKAEPTGGSLGSRGGGGGGGPGGGPGARASGRVRGQGVEPIAAQAAAAAQVCKKSH